MSPELLKLNDVNYFGELNSEEKCDVFSLGITFIRLIILQIKILRNFFYPNLILMSMKMLFKDNQIFRINS